MTWNVDPNHSQVTFSAKHMGIFTVRGQFEQFDIDLDFNKEAPEKSSVVARLAANSINTSNGQRDGHLMSPDFLNADTYPELVFKSTKVELTGEKTGKIYGELTIRDQTRPVVLEGHFTDEVKTPWGTVSAGFVATTKIDRTEWGLTWNQALETGGLLVGNEITVSLELEAIREPTLEETRQDVMSVN